MSIAPFHDIPSVQAHVGSRYAAGSPGRAVRPESSLRVLAHSLRRTRRAEEGAGARS
jgi:hypothetical protein